MVLQVDRLWPNSVPGNERLDVLFESSSQRQSGVYIRNTARSDSADDDLIWEKSSAARYCFPSFFRAEQTVDGRDMGVPDERYTWKSKQIGVQDGLDRRNECAGGNSGRAEQFFDIRVCIGLKRTGATWLSFNVAS